MRAIDSELALARISPASFSPAAASSAFGTTRFARPIASARSAETKSGLSRSSRRSLPRRRIGRIGGDDRGDEADAHFAVEEAGIVGGDDEVAGGRESAAAGDAGALDKRQSQRLLPENRLEEVAQPPRVEPVVERRGRLQRLQMFEVGAGAEVLAGTRQQDGAHPFGAQVAAIERGELGGERRRKSVRPRRIVQGDERRSPLAQGALGDRAIGDRAAANFERLRAAPRGPRSPSRACPGRGSCPGRRSAGSRFRRPRGRRAAGS